MYSATTEKREDETPKIKAWFLGSFPAGIGDHSTKDFWDNATESLKLLASADERLETLEKYFSGKDTLNEGPTYTTTIT